MELEWTRRHIIGQGSSSTVYLATTTTTTAAAAVKSAELSQSQHLQREAQILSSLSSPYIVPYKGQAVTKENKNLIFNLFMEYMPSGTLSQAARSGRLREPAIRRYTGQVAEGLRYLHSKGLVHCDIKGSNILIDEEGVVKIGDFGFAKSVADASAAPVAGTPAFMSPEAARGEEQGFPSDVWALGCTVVEMATGSVPWANAGDPVSVLYRVGHCGDVPEIPRFLSEEAKDFLGKCFMRDPRERWSASQLLNHPFLVGFGSELDDDDEVEVEVVKVVEGSNSCSPTSILEQGIWNSVEESESECTVQKTSCFGDSPNDRIKRLAALCSCDPNWNWGDGDWINARVNENENEVEGCCIDDGSVAASNSVSDDNYVSISHNRIISAYFCEGFVKCSRDVSVVSHSLNFERGVAEIMLLPFTLDIL